ncbi:hypothetical protein V8C35DRAFT_293747 [Trichoderma chlorosporum]
MEYPPNVDLSDTSATQIPQANTDGTGQAIRKPFPSVTNAVKKCDALSLSQIGWEHVKNTDGPATDAGGSTTTSSSATAPSAAGDSHGNNVDDSDVHNGLSDSRVQALDASPASRGHNTRGATSSSAMSVSSVNTLDSKAGGSSYGTANAPYAEHELSHMAPWAQGDINNLGKQ